MRLTPRGGRDAIEGAVTLGDGTVVLKARVRAAPENGEANAALMNVLAKWLQTPIGRLELIHGATARIKTVAVRGSAREIIRRLTARLEGEATNGA